MRKLLLGGLAALCALVFAVTAGASEGFYLTLQAAPTVVPVGGNLTLSGYLRNDDGGGLEHKAVQIRAYDGASCSGESTYYLTQTTDPGGHFGVTGTVTFGPGVFSWQAFSVHHTVSPCVSVLVYDPNAGPLAVKAQSDSHAFLCYSVGGTPYTASVNDGTAALLLASGYWSPSAVTGTVAGGTNVGGFHLVCAAPLSGSLGNAPIADHYTDNIGDLLEPAAAQATGGIGVYPIVGAVS